MDEIRLAGDGIEVMVLPGIGGRIHRLRAFGEDLLRTPADPAAHVSEPFNWGAYPMAPWANRIEAGRTSVAGQSVALRSNFPDGSAIHGQVYERPWQVLGPTRLVVRGGGQGWPWRYEVEERFEIRDQALFVMLTLVNRSDEPMPAGVGLHPWFRTPVRVAIHGDRVYPSNAATRSVPEPVAGSLDQRALGELAVGTDATWVGLGDPSAELHWPDTGIRLTLGISAPHRCVVAARPPGTDSIAVEAQTHAPDGLGRLLRGEPDGLVYLEPGANLPLTVTFAFAQF